MLTTFCLFFRGARDLSHIDRDAGFAKGKVKHACVFVRLKSRKPEQNDSLESLCSGCVSSFRSKETADGGMCMKRAGKNYCGDLV